jgi:hypothetical protein
MEKRDAHIFDVDGTLCNVRGIRHLIDSPGGFDAFHYASASCLPNPWVADKARRLHSEGVAILVVTGRVEKFRRLTSWWLADHAIPSDKLEMRADGDFRKDFIVKREILRRLQLNYNIIGADDDNPHVIALWEHEGIPYTVVPGWDGPT